MLPPLDDELAKAASEFDTLDELRGDIEGRLRAQVEEELEGLFRAAAVDELVKATKFTARGPARRGAHARAAERARAQPRRSAASTPTPTCS